MPRGVKTCPVCKRTTGPRAVSCAGCGWSFVQKAPSGSDEAVNYGLNNPHPDELIVAQRDAKVSQRPHPPVVIKSPNNPTRVTVAGLIKKLGLAVLLTEVIDYCLTTSVKPAAHQQVAFKLNGATAKAHEYSL